jgi:hypothetical protein
MAVISLRKSAANPKPNAAAAIVESKKDGAFISNFNNRVPAKQGAVHIKQQRRLGVLKSMSTEHNYILRAAPWGREKHCVA